jgi:hypothetical protein
MKCLGKVQSLSKIFTCISLHFTYFLLLLNLLSCYGLEYARYVTRPNTWTSLIGNEHNELCDKTGDARFVVLKCGLSKFRPLSHDTRCICSTGSVTE